MFIIFISSPTQEPPSIHKTPAYFISLNTDYVLGTVGVQMENKHKVLPLEACNFRQDYWSYVS